VTRIGELGTTLAVTNNRRTFLRRVRRLLVTASVVPSSQILVTLMKDVPPKRRFLQEPNGVTSQNTPFFNVRVVFYEVLFTGSQAFITEQKLNLCTQNSGRREMQQRDKPFSIETARYDLKF
jgi:hypothetical protein